ncbi:nuclear transport factor 2 family protein [Streptomyces sp. NPDC090493]|uniref:nuclear transport factor 2 family protein n=1 Tax=Streptomyces sp. NPDC090493 TaxID=3365964 RepID=UPI00382669EF
MAQVDAELRLQKMEAVHEVENLLGRYEFYHLANLHRECLDLYALDTEGVKIEMDWGVFEGREGVERFFLHYLGGADPAAERARRDTGGLHLHSLTTPLIEVADDLQTARGLWTSPGNETIPTGPGGSFRAYWIWIKYGVDFVRENGEWKIWHQATCNLFMTPYETSWAAAEPMPPRRELPPHRAPDRVPPQPPAWRYAVDKVLPNLPEPPEPYASFDQTGSY